MKQYIDKSALVAEIEKRIKEIDEIGTYLSPKGVLTNLLCHINTLEVKEISDEYNGFLGKELKIVDNEIARLEKLKVKEVNIDKETTHYLLCEHRSPLNKIMHKADLKSEMQYHKDIEKAFKAGFKLGMAVSNKAQKGEEV